VGFSKTEVTIFYNSPEEVMMKYKFPPTHVFNMDETGSQTVKSCSYFSNKRREKELVYHKLRAACTVSVNGGFIPPMSIFSRQKVSSSGKGWVSLYYLPLFETSLEK
jgi:hypothetical protein